jgi:hypothetical protein
MKPSDRSPDASGFPSGSLNLRPAGWILFGAGLAASAFFSVEHREIVNWQHYALGIAAALAGALILRLTTDRSAGLLILDIQIIRSSLTMLSAKLKNLDTTKREQLGMDGLRDFIDRHLTGDRERFLGARETLIFLHGLRTYGQVMDAFAAGERALNRAWSALADGYRDEAHGCLDRARDKFAHALRLVEEAEKR